MENNYKIILNQYIAQLILLFTLISSICVSAQQKFCSDGVVSFELLTGHELKSKSHLLTTISTLHLTECIDFCRQNNSCKSVNYETGLCKLMSTSANERPETLIASQTPVFKFFAQKLCLSDKNSACAQGWAFETVKGYELKRMSKKSVRVQTRTECMQLCLNEQQFDCRSANFDSDINICWLSDMDRHTINVNEDLKTRLFAVAAGSVDYIENNCIPEPKKFCEFSPLNGKILKTVDSVFENINSIKDCKEKCLNSGFRCHSFDYSNNICRLSHLDKNSLAHIDSPYLRVAGATTYELLMCYNVTVSCRSREMVARVRTSRQFNGKIYAKNNPNNCINDITNSLEFDIKMQYNTDECGVKQSSPGHFTNDIVIQHHDMVVTTRDLALGVYCKFDLYNDSISFLDLTIDGDIMTDRLRGTAKLPDLSLHIVDINGEDINEVALGETLRVQVRMSDEATYGIFVRNLIAKDGLGGTNNLTLIDNSGCPVEAKMMREVRTINKDQKSLESYLEAFTFTGSQLLEIEAEVETCLDKCRPVQCKIITGRSDDEYETVTSYGKRRRKRSPVEDLELAEKGDILSLTMLSKRVSINSNSEVTKIEIPNKKQVNAMPYRKSKSLPANDSQPFRVFQDEHGFYCFEPTTLATLSGLTLLFHVFMLITILIMATRLKGPRILQPFKH